MVRRWGDFSVGWLDSWTVVYLGSAWEKLKDCSMVFVQVEMTAVLMDSMWAPLMAGSLVALMDFYSVVYLAVVWVD